MNDPHPDAFSELGVHHVPWNLKLVLALGVILGTVGIGLGVWNYIGQQQIADQRASDRIASDLAGCARGNEFRSQVQGIGQAGKQLDQDILSVFLPASDPRAAQVEVALQPAFAKFQAAIDKVKTIDCQAVTPGATKGQP